MAVRVKSLVWLLVVVVLVTGCQSVPPEIVEVVQEVQAIAQISTAVVTPTPFQPLRPTQTFTPAAVPRLAVDDSVPSALHTRLAFDGQVVLAESEENANVFLGVGTEIESNPQVDWIYALVAPFPTVVDGIGLDEMKNAWTGEPSNTFAGSPLLMTADTCAAFAAVWGDPADGGVMILESDALLDHAWNHMPAWALVPFETLDPRWKVLRVGGASPIDRDFDPISYPLRIIFGLYGDPMALRMLRERPGEMNVTLPPSNYDPSKKTTVVLTGVTALVRATGDKMERNGMTYPGEDIREWLLDADLTHVSNEVSFANDCPDANPLQADLRFCSRPEFIELLEYVDVDIIELTGNHILDWSTVAFTDTLEMYRARDWYYFAGGKDEAEARQPLLMEHNSNRLAFIGCNAVGPGYAWAEGSKPGAAKCGDYEWIKAEISNLAGAGYIVIVTLQHNEFNVLTSTPYQRRDFPALSEAGASIVSGSQAHYPNPFAFYDGRFIHYGLGNLFFDQMDAFIAPGIQREFIDRHIFYDGRHVSTEILTAHLEDFSRPRPMTDDERTAFLMEAFEASGW